MAIQIVKSTEAKQTKAPKLKPVELQAETSTLVKPEVVDEYLTKKADYEKKAAKLAPLAKEIADLEAQFIAVADEAVPADEPTVLVGTDPKITIELSAKGNQTKITDRAKLIELIGEDQFMEIAQIGITEAKKYLTEKQFNSVSTTERVTKRRVRVVEA